MTAVDLKNQLVAGGLVIDHDFEWEYHTAHHNYDNDGYSAVTPRRVVFKFRDPAMATFYQLKWLR